jgi:hypothetical protein
MVYNLPYIAIAVLELFPFIDFHKRGAYDCGFGPMFIKALVKWGP